MQGGVVRHGFCFYNFDGMGKLAACLTVVLLVLSCSREKGMYHVGVLQWTEQIEAYRETYRGVVDGLEEEGFVEGKNLKLLYENAEGDRKRALAVAKTWVAQGVDLIITLGTGSTLAAMEATSSVPIVYSVVGDPEATGIKGPNVTGTSMKIPVQEQLRKVLAFMPSVRRVGVLYCSEMPQAVATAEEALRAARQMGLQAVEIKVSPEELWRLEEILEAKLTMVDFLYIPTDPVLHRPSLFERIKRMAMKYYVPVIGVSRDVVEQGALLAYHPDFYEVGRQTAHQAALVLEGVPVSQIPPEGPIVKLLSFNVRTARDLLMTVDRELLQRADRVFY